MSAVATLVNLEVLSLASTPVAIMTLMLEERRTLVKKADVGKCEARAE